MTICSKCGNSNNPVVERYSCTLFLEEIEDE